MFRKLPDRFSIGLLFGIITLSLAYLLVRTVRVLMVHYYGNEYLLAPPRVQLYAIAINVIVFRFVIVKFDKEQTGKGILFSTVILALIYFFLYMHYNFRMG